MNSLMSLECLEVQIIPQEQNVKEHYCYFPISSREISEESIEDKKLSSMWGDNVIRVRFFRREKLIHYDGESSLSKREDVSGWIYNGEVYPIDILHRIGAVSEETLERLKDSEKRFYIAKNGQLFELGEEDVTFDEYVEKSKKKPDGKELKKAM